MAKGNSQSVRLDAALVEGARVTSKIEHRSTAKQIEYWASIGRAVSRSLDANTLLNIAAGTLRVSASPIVGAAPDFDAVMGAVDADAAPPRERVGLASGQVAYRASKSHPGLIERVSGDGSATVGTYRNGRFQPLAAQSVEAEAAT
jgi:hypothetical protein